MALHFISRTVGPPDAAAVALRAVILKFQVVTALATPDPDTLRRLMAPWSSDERNRFLEEWRRRCSSTEELLKK